MKKFITMRPMNKMTIAGVSLIAISLGIFALNNGQATKGQTSTTAQSQPVQATPQSPHPANAPEHIVYRQFFQHLMALKDRADGVERKGGDGRGLRAYFKDKAKLNDDQGRVLDQVAADCQRDVAKLDTRAKKIIDAYRAQFPKGRATNSQNLPPLPPELQSLQQQRDMTILHARKRLQNALGETAFHQLDDFIKVDAQRNGKPGQTKQAVSSPSGTGQ